MNLNLKYILYGISVRMMKWPRRKYHEMKAKRCKNQSICLLCNNCTGGVILHDLGLRFNTPTINIGIRNQDEFMYFIENVEHFIDSDVYEIDIEKYHLPAGYVMYDNKSVDVVFTHYKTFEEGRHKWLERIKRIDLNHIYIIYEGPALSDSFLERFSRLPYKKVILSSRREKNNYTFYHGFKFYEKWKPGMILEYKSWFSVKRFLDDFDYVSFFNNE